MPTKRAGVIFAMALIFYLLANQTQVGWIYIFTNILLGFLIVSFFYARGLLSRLIVTRSIRPVDDQPQQMSMQDEIVSLPDLDRVPTFHEDDAVEIKLTCSQTGIRPLFLVDGREFCPFAPEHDQDQSLFIPTLFRSEPLQFAYSTVCDRRGVFSLSHILVQTTGPFGLFRTKRTLNAPSNVMIYPAYHPLNRLRHFENRNLAERQAQRVGAGSQIIGTRDYQRGDSLRLIHWRSTARMGNLVVKEFSDDEDRTLTVVLDLHQQASVGQGKHSTFETAIRVAASLSHYAENKKIPFYLQGTSQNWIPPKASLSWWATLNYLAKVEQDGQQPLETILPHLKGTNFYIILISQASPAVIQALQTLAQRQLSVLPIFITPSGELPSGANKLETAISLSPFNWASVLSTL
ncbi:MAG: DUF58 domain-containing protein [Chloroflexota bacterium]